MSFFNTLCTKIKVFFTSISIEVVAEVSVADILKNRRIQLKLSIVATAGNVKKKTCEVDKTCILCFLFF